MRDERDAAGAGAKKSPPALPGAQLVVVPRMRASIDLEQPEAVNAALAEWLAAETLNPVRDDERNDSRDTAGVIAPPPLMALAAVCSGLLLDWSVPGLCADGAA